MARPRSFDRDHVLHAAERQFPGYNGTSADDISAATDLGRGSLSPEPCRTANRSTSTPAEGSTTGPGCR
ncbi:hypothetical protein [Streptomyces sp. ID05-47C]|uniref:hypothetical protein n=1 Tax=Streptomyces sp. ID05-47C TaxID=3028665 RepID=UPI0029B373E9|nr:hypothetical protein [Streptomyces sp. ID05-47C]